MKKIFIVIRDYAESSVHEVNVLAASVDRPEAEREFEKACACARAYAARHGFITAEQIGVSVETFRPNAQVEDHFNVYIVSVPFGDVADSPDGRSVGEKMKDSLAALRSIPSGGYWPYASPAPCSTEVWIKDNLDAAISRLDNALFFHEQMFGRTGRNPMRAPAMAIVQSAGDPSGNKTEG